MQAAVAWRGKRGFWAAAELLHLSVGYTSVFSLWTFKSLPLWFVHFFPPNTFPSSTIRESWSAGVQGSKNLHLINKLPKSFTEYFGKDWDSPVIFLEFTKWLRPTCFKYSKSPFFHHTIQGSPIPCNQNSQQEGSSYLPRNWSLVPKRLGTAGPIYRIKSSLPSNSRPP